MNQETKRIGRFTSSGIGALMTFAKDGKSFGKPALSYIAEKKMERRLGRSLQTDTTSKPTSWGKACELRVFELLGLEYQLQHKTTIEHPELAEYWAGSPDMLTEDAVCEIKSPYTLKSFCQFADCKSIDEIRENHPDGEDYYWQCVSNAILCNKKKVEFIVYCPYRSELSDIRDWVNNLDGDQKPYEFINYASDYELPFLIDGGYYKNLNVWKFDVPESDMLALQDRIMMAIYEMNKP